MNTKHTPGPWEDVGANKDGERCIYGADDSAVAATIPVGNPDSKLQRSEANARLIAAAPELLAACEALISSSRFMREEYGDMNQAVEAAEKVIAAATGETK